MSDNIIIFPEHGKEKHSDRTRTIFVSATGQITTGAEESYDGFGTVVFSDGLTKSIIFSLALPSDLVEITDFKVIMLPSLAGDIYCKTFMSGGGDEESHSGTNATNSGYVAIALSPSDVTHIKSFKGDLALSPFDKNDVLGVDFRRYAGNALDTIDEEVHIFGFLFEYTADS